MAENAENGHVNGNHELEIAASEDERGENERIDERIEPVRRVPELVFDEDALPGSRVAALLPGAIQSLVDHALHRADGGFPRGVLRLRDAALDHLGLPSGEGVVDQRDELLR